jgi:hypothetical protein
MADDLSVLLTADEAVTAIKAAAWAEHTPDEAYREAVEAISAMCAGRASVAVEEISAVISARIPEPRKRIHATAGGIGADWDADAAVRFARQPGAACSWAWSLMEHDLLVIANDRLIRFEVRAPEEIREQLLAAERKRIAEALRG